MTQTIKPGLDGVPETMLWPLHNRAVFSQRHPDLLRDPQAETLIDRIEYDFVGHFGPANVSHAIRARYCDDLVRAFKAQAGDRAVVVALGEGLETQAFRIDDPGLAWITVDLPEAIDIRQQLLPIPEHHQLVPCSALDTHWIDAVPTDQPVFISAAGLLMYFESDAVATLLQTIATRLPGAELFFDTIPPALGKRSKTGMQVTAAYRSPPMPWSISFDAITQFLAANDWEAVSVQTYAQPYPEHMKLYAFLSRFGPIRRAMAPGLVHARATSSSAASAA